MQAADQLILEAAVLQTAVVVASVSASRELALAVGLERAAVMDADECHHVVVDALSLALCPGDEIFSV